MSYHCFSLHDRVYITVKYFRCWMDITPPLLLTVMLLSVDIRYFKDFFKGHLRQCIFLSFVWAPHFYKCFMSTTEFYPNVCKFYFILPLYLDKICLTISFTSMIQIWGCLTFGIHLIN